jgi:sulfide:quinone oxidoreductase
MDYSISSFENQVINWGHTFGDTGLVGHWLKLAFHHAFIYKSKMRPLWWLFPE